LGALIALGALYIARKGGAPAQAQTETPVADQIAAAWKALETEVVNVSDKLTMSLGNR
jgi:hypothetical protein